MSILALLLINNIMSKQKTKAKTIRLDPHVITTIEDLAKEENRNFSNMVETILLKVAKSPDLIRGSL